MKFRIALRIKTRYKLKNYAWYSIVVVRQTFTGDGLRSTVINLVQKVIIVGC